MPKLLDLEFLYYFSSDSICILEAKINGLEEGTPPDKIYHWLYYDRTAQQFLKLGFKSMGSQNDRDYREFDQGELWFDASKAKLAMQTVAAAQEFPLRVNPTEAIPADLISRVQHFLLQKLNS